jgi:pilus assembly protein Flp/PilA
MRAPSVRRPLDRPPFQVFSLAHYTLKEIVMNHLATTFKKFVRDEDGVTAIEYGLIAALIAVVIIASVKAVGTNLSTVFNNIATAL